MTKKQQALTDVVIGSRIMALGLVTFHGPIEEARRRLSSAASTLDLTDPDESGAVHAIIAANDCLRAIERDVENLSQKMLAALELLKQLPNETNSDL